MNCHFVYRSTGKENRKERPAFYTKAVALASFLSAIGALPAAGEIVFVNDAPIAPELEEVMRRHGSVVNLPGLTMLASYWRAIAVPDERGWADEDLVYFSEDDYLFRPDAFVSLFEISRQVPGDAYFALYASYDGLEPSGRPVPVERRRTERVRTSYTAAGHRWVTALSTTSSFAVRVGTLRRDRWLHRYAPRTGGAWDHAISLAHSGRMPFGLITLADPLWSRDYKLVHAARQATLRLGLDVLGIAAKLHPRPLIATVPALATHMEVPHVATGTDWAAVAAATQWPAAPVARASAATAAAVQIAAPPAPGSRTAPMPRSTLQAMGRRGLVIAASVGVIAAAWMAVHRARLNHHHHAVHAHAVIPQSGGALH